MVSIPILVTLTLCMYTWAALKWTLCAIRTHSPTLQINLQYDGQAVTIWPVLKCSAQVVGSILSFIGQNSFQAYYVPVLVIAYTFFPERIVTERLQLYFTILMPFRMIGICVWCYTALPSSLTRKVALFILAILIGALLSSEDPDALWTSLSNLTGCFGLPPIWWFLTRLLDTLTHAFLNVPRQRDISRAFGRSLDLLSKVFLGSIRSPVIIPGHRSYELHQSEGRHTLVSSTPPQRSLQVASYKNPDCECVDGNNVEIQALAGQSGHDRLLIQQWPNRSEADEFPAIHANFQRRFSPPRKPLLEQADFSKPLASIPYHPPTAGSPTVSESSSNH